MKPPSGSKKTNPNKPNFETTLIGISQAPASSDVSRCGGQANRYLAKGSVSGTTWTSVVNL